ncbi:MAG TPA: hypothetical protein VF043_02860 [Ktedonobacteraceae bacterium]
MTFVEEASESTLMKPDEQYGPVGSRILFENDLVRVWEISLEPGEHLLQHYHALPYLVVTIEAALVRVVEHDGQAFDPTVLATLHVRSQKWQCSPSYFAGANRLFPISSQGAFDRACGEGF